LLATLTLAGTSVCLFWKPASPGTPANHHADLFTAGDEVDQVTESINGAPAGLLLPGELLHDERAEDWLTPIEFYGKVLDEMDRPVASASVAISVNDLSASGTTHYNVASDLEGNFQVTGIRGKTIMVDVRHPQFYSSNQSRFSAFYAGSETNFAPNPRMPVVFRLFAKGTPESLLVFGSTSTRQFKLGTNGAPIDISLNNGKVVEAGKGDIRIQRWVRSPGINQRRYDWKYVVSVPGGGILEYTNEFEFMAPPEGYRESVERSMAADLTEGWTDRAGMRCFVRLRTGRYARFHFRIYAEKIHGIAIEYCVNPTGSRNLEFDSQLPNTKVDK
jgi:hypothetical protein